MKLLSALSVLFSLISLVVSQNSYCKHELSADQAYKCKFGSYNLTDCIGKIRCAGYINERCKDDSLRSTNKYKVCSSKYNLACAMIIGKDYGLCEEQGIFRGLSNVIEKKAFPIFYNRLYPFDSYLDNQNSNMNDDSDYNANENKLYYY